MHYYDMLIGVDLTVFPSYYEPWGYTPLESIAFKVPCVTTSLSGFGAWANEEKSKRVGCLFQNSTLIDGVEVINRTDYNYDEVVESIREAIIQYSSMSDAEVNTARKAASALAQRLCGNISSSTTTKPTTLPCARPRAVRRNNEK
jgi:glycosyltransferase involved in cell wall biosynthesis